MVYMEFSSLGYSAYDIAKLIIKKYNDENEYISNLMLQKLLFFVQKNSLKNNQKLIFNDEFEAWKFGPVIPNVYYKFCHYGALPIKLKKQEILIDDEYVKTIICEEFNRWKGQSPFALVRESHKSGGSWEKVIKNSLGFRKIIPCNLIYELG